MESVASLVKGKVKRLNQGEVIDYKTFNTAPNQAEALAKVLSRLTYDGVIKRLSKGIYYKPKKTVFGDLKPSEDKLLKRFLANGYITGIMAYNQMGFTSQIPSEIKIATDKRKSPISFGGLKIRFVISKEKINNKTRELLPILDAIKDIKVIPDSDLNTNINHLVNTLKTLNESQLQILLKTAMRYNPSTRALFGALVEKIRSDLTTQELKDSLNSLSKYNFKIDAAILPNKASWNIN